jgi:hypothetical protein
MSGGEDLYVRCVSPSPARQGVKMIDSEKFIFVPLQECWAEVAGWLKTATWKKCLAHKCSCFCTRAWLALPAIWVSMRACSSHLRQRYYVGHKGKFGHEFLEFEFNPDGEFGFSQCSATNDPFPALIHAQLSMVFLCGYFPRWFKLTWGQGSSAMPTTLSTRTTPSSASRLAAFASPSPPLLPLFSCAGDANLAAHNGRCTCLPLCCWS